MSQTKQEDFDYYLHLGEDFFYMDEAIKDAFIRSIGELYPDFVKHYDTSMYSVFSIMEACYYGGFCSEPKEKLYKADLFNIAFVADNIYGINTEGTSPENILNMPIRLARILDDKAFRFLLEDPKFIENSQKAYKRYSVLPRQPVPCWHDLGQRLLRRCYRGPAFNQPAFTCRRRGKRCLC